MDCNSRPKQCLILGVFRGGHSDRLFFWLRRDSTTVRVHLNGKLLYSARRGGRSEPTRLCRFSRGCWLYKCRHPTSIDVGFGKYRSRMLTALAFLALVALGEAGKLPQTHSPSFAILVNNTLVCLSGLLGFLIAHSLTAHRSPVKSNQQIPTSSSVTCIAVRRLHRHAVNSGSPLLHPTSPRM